MLQHESYSKIHGLRSLLGKLEHSLSQRVIQVEQLSRSLDSPSDTAVEVLAAALKDDSESGSTALTPAPWSDNRNYDLMVALEGVNVMDEATVRALGGTAVRVAAFLRGEAAPDAPDVPSSTPSSAVDAAYVSGVDVLLRAAGGDGSPATIFDGKRDLAILTTALISTHQEAKTPLDSMSSLLSLYQLSQVLDAVAKRVSPAVKGKKKTPAQLAFVEGAAEATAKLCGIRLPEGITSDSRDAALSIVNDETLVDEVVERIKTAQAQLHLDELFK